MNVGQRSSDHLTRHAFPALLLSLNNSILVHKYYMLQDQPCDQYTLRSRSKTLETWYSYDTWKYASDDTLTTTE